MTRSRAATRARLLDAAFDVFAAKGFGHASIEDVCDAAGYTRGAFYSNFASLDELFFELYEDRAQALIAHVTDALQAAGEGHSIPELVKRVVAALPVDRDWLLVRTDFMLYAARHPDAAARLREHRDALRAAVANPIAQAVGGGPRSPAVPRSLRTPNGLARAVAAVHDGAATQLLLDPDPAALRRWLTDLLTTLLDNSTQATRR